MPILQNKLVWKSIEALHDEAVATLPDAAIDIGIVKSRPTAILQQSSATQTPLKTAGGDDVMARIDQLLGKLDEDNDAATAQSAPPANDQTASKEIADEATATITQADDTAASISASKSAPDDAPVQDDPKQNDPGQSDPVQNDSVQELNDIAAAIHQAQQSQINSDASPADPDLAPALDMAVLSATIADEVRHSVSAMIAAEMPQMLRQAVVEAIREMPTATPGQPTPKATKKTRAKPGTAKKTTGTKTTGKKAVTKKAAAKKAAS